MQDNNNSKIHQTIREYLSLKIDEYKLKGVDSLTILTNKIIFLFLVTLFGGVMLQLLGIALAMLIGDLLGKMWLGFLVMALLFAITLFILFLCRKKLFVNKLVRLYIDMFFKN